VERRKFNELVRSYNTTIRKFPNSLIAGITGFDQKGFFQAVEGSDVAPVVEF
jgi:LemA protein